MGFVDSKTLIFCTWVVKVWFSLKIKLHRQIVSTVRVFSFFPKQINCRQAHLFLILVQKPALFSLFSLHAIHQSSPIVSEMNYLLRHCSTADGSVIQLLSSQSIKGHNEHLQFVFLIYTRRGAAAVAKNIQ